MVLDMHYAWSPVLIDQNSVNWHFSVQSHRKLNSFFFGEMQAQYLLDHLPAGVDIEIRLAS